MDNKQAAAVLRTIATPAGLGPGGLVRTRVEDASARGADALEMLEWLFEIGRFGELHSEFIYEDSSDMTFHAFCKERFRKYRKGLEKQMTSIPPGNNSQ